MNDFNEFWSLYPRRVSKRTAQKAWDKETKQTAPEVILSGLRRQLPYLQSRDAQFIPHASTWLNQGRWEDETQPVQRNTGRRTIADAAREYITSNDYRGDAFGLPSIGRH
ncbi:hypothetical protein ELG76_04100 [Rhizobium leguminosarum]|uniref:hypothetical protein n=1 Tax=Rhizobium leguminosarum TaxID=384 RepID=UPI001031A5E4|nr:hypothetical protein [Rhizobium leguminosarum]TBG78602.1 hypothetical protein ELG76_04100 [Rhizobium leguminosarum]